MDSKRFYMLEMTLKNTRNTYLNGFGLALSIYDILDLDLTNTQHTSSHQRCSLKKGVLKNYTNSQENTCARVPVNFVKILKTPFLQNTSERLLLSALGLLQWTGIGFIKHLD